jgi:hypothetical protein
MALSGPEGAGETRGGALTWGVGRGVGAMNAAGGRYPGKDTPTVAHISGVGDPSTAPPSPATAVAMGLENPRAAAAPSQISLRLMRFITVFAPMSGCC